ncbi:pilus assembly protein CpaF [Amycolatopsis sp. NBRC 101858]|uniref:CpaF family protein n=1 Tax=Amycolatopsis sp. NBRC 101858 TaxID=3032200 RepID=UPI00249FB88E|nr:CpaF/VirB11 family protein [Amycolatopsis sp. NBRC 101858]GLY38834.1 pilus assembly protein CpaF [Amycolatopsis sp. NBRC 101858]
MSADAELVDRVQRRMAPLVQQESARRGALGEPRDDRAIAEALLDDVLAAAIKEWAGSGRPFLDFRQEQQIRSAVLAEMFGLGRLEALLADDGVENIDIIGSDPVWLSYHDGRVERVAGIAPTDQAVVQWLQRIAARMGRTEHTINDARPLLNMELPGGERLAAAIGVTDRPHISIRRHRLPTAGLEALRERGMLSTAQLALLRAAVRAEKNVIICGRQKAGKTTLLRALCWEVPATERFATLETEFELGLHRHRDRFPAVVAFEEREGNSERWENGKPVGGVDLPRLVWQSLRMHAARTVVGEVRGGEIIPMLNALSAGGSGSLSTLHARSAAQAIHRMALLCLEANSAWTPEFAYEVVANTIDLIVYVELVQQPGRLDRHIAEVVAIEPGEYGRPARTYLFAPEDGRRSVPTGNLPTDIEDYERGGFDRTWLTSSGDGGWLADRSTP